MTGFGERIVGAFGERLVDIPQRLAQLMLDLLAISVISALLVANRPRLQRFALSLVARRHREHTGDVLDKMWHRLGHYVRAKLIVMAIIGTITFVPLFLLGVQYPLLLAGIVALGEAIPQVGPWIARVPLFAIAALEDWQTLAAVVVLSVIVENLKGYLISPYVEGDQLSIDPLVVMLSPYKQQHPVARRAFVAVPQRMVRWLYKMIPWRHRQNERPGGRHHARAAARLLTTSSTGQPARHTLPCRAAVAATTAITTSGPGCRARPARASRRGAFLERLGRRRSVPARSPARRGAIRTGSSASASSAEPRPSISSGGSHGSWPRAPPQRVATRSLRRLTVGSSWPVAMAVVRG